MIGIIYYLIFIFIGLYYGARLFEDEPLCVRIWSGGIIGNMILMCAVLPFAFIFGFGKTAHLLAAAAAAAPGAALAFKGKRIKSENGALGEYMRLRTLFALTALSLMICILLTNHIMVPVPEGIASGQSTYGDLAMHMGFVSSIAEQGSFPPEYNQLAGARLGYPFLADSLSASLYLFGTPLR